MPYQGMLAETVSVQGHRGKNISAYMARPIGAGPYPGVVLIHHAPGWDEWYFEAARRFAHHGYVAIAPNLYSDFGGGSADDISAQVRAAGGVSDDDVVEDSAGCIKLLRSLPYGNGKVGVFGTCSGGRHAYVVACRLGKEVDAAADLWGGGVIMEDKDLTPKRPTSPHLMTKSLTAPLLGIFGNDDKNPAPDQVNVTEEELKSRGKSHEFYRYDGAGHGFFYYDRPAYRIEQALDGWRKVWAFFAKNLGK